MRRLKNASPQKNYKFEFARMDGQLSLFPSALLKVFPAADLSSAERKAFFMSRHYCQSTGVFWSYRLVAIDDRLTPDTKPCCVEFWGTLKKREVAHA